MGLRLPSVTSGDLPRRSTTSGEALPGRSTKVSARGRFGAGDGGSTGSDKAAASVLTAILSSSSFLREPSLAVITMAIPIPRTARAPPMMIQPAHWPVSTVCASSKGAIADLRRRFCWDRTTAPSIGYLKYTECRLHRRGSKLPPANSRDRPVVQPFRTQL